MITIDETRGVVLVRDETGERSLPMSSAEAFEVVARAYLRVGWDTKYVYTFSWFGRPIIQLPDDLVRMQEVLWAVKPDAVVETGVAHGGSLIFYASLLKAMGVPARVVGVDVEIRPHNRKAIEAHPLFPMISLVEGNSTAPETVHRVRQLLDGKERVLVVLDSNHTKAHVAGELEAYAPLVTVGSYVIATDGIMKDVVGGPRTHPDWSGDNPYAAACEFAARHSGFVQAQPHWPFDESVGLKQNVTYWPGAWLKRIC